MIGVAVAMMIYNLQGKSCMDLYRNVERFLKIVHSHVSQSQWDNDEIIIDMGFLNYLYCTTQLFSKLFLTQLKLIRIWNIIHFIELNPLLRRFWKVCRSPIIETPANQTSTSWWKLKQNVYTEHGVDDLTNSTACIYRWPVVHLLALISIWICNHMRNKVWDEITYPLSNFKSAAVDVYGWISNYIPHFIIDMAADACWN